MRRHRQGESGRQLLGVLAISILAVCAIAGPARAFERMYSSDELIKDWPRLKKAVNGIYGKGFVPFFTDEERRALADVEIRLPLPKARDELLNFYAYFDQGRPVVVLPLLSLKVMEDLTTAFAWLFANKHDLSKLEIYFTMVRYRDRSRFPGGRVPAILTALGIPQDALKDPSVDKLSLSLRNEAFAFLLAHELGHIRFRHKGYGSISKAQARADEMQSDRFAMDLMGRTKTPMVGPFLFFQSQVYSMPHRAEFETPAAWETYLKQVSTHPLSSERLTALGDFVERFGRRLGGAQRQMWRVSAAYFKQFVRFIESGPRQKCMVRVARQAQFEILRPTRALDLPVVLKHCRGVFR